MELVLLGLGYLVLPLGKHPLARLRFNKLLNREPTGLPQGLTLQRQETKHLLKVIEDTVPLSIQEALHLTEKAVPLAREKVPHPTIL